MSQQVIYDPREDWQLILWTYRADVQSVNAGDFEDASETLRHIIKKQNTKVEEMKRQGVQFAAPTHDLSCQGVVDTVDTAVVAALSAGVRNLDTLSFLSSGRYEQTLDKYASCFLMISNQAHHACQELIPKQYYLHIWGCVG